MFFAIEPSTGVEVSADTASRDRTYRCPTCGARVALRKGPERADHFAHLQWAAKPDCENYSPSRFEYRRRPPGEGRVVGPGVATSYLSFTLSIDGPRLAYWFPPSPVANWSGAIEFEAHDTSRAFKAGNLRNGQRIEFALVDGQWDVRDTGDVPDEYLALLTRGRQSLDASGSLFDATTAAGRQIVPGQSVAYGQVLYWVSRVQLDPLAKGVRRCAVEKLHLSSGWHVYRIQLPEAAYTGDDFMELVQWLERRIRPARPSVWIESPWPRSTTTSGFSVYEPTDGELAVKADRPVDIKIADARTGADVLIKLSRQNLSIGDIAVGVYDLFVNDLPHETFVVEAASGGEPAAVLVQVGEQPPVALAYAQPALSALIARESQSVPLVLTWGHPEVEGVVKLRRQSDGQDEVAGATVLMSAGMRLDAASLGRLEWPAEIPVAAEQNQQVFPQLRERATWLLSLAGSSPFGGSERVTVPDALRKDALFQRLAMASWRLELAPHVRAMSKSLGE